MRLAFIGRSHLVALHAAAQDMRAELDAAGCSLTFKPAGYDATDYTIADGRLHASFASSRLRRRLQDWGVAAGIGIDDHDAFFIVGGMPFNIAVRTYAACRGESHANPGHVVPFVSDACFETAVAGLLRETPLWRLGNALAAAAPTAPIAFVSAPFYVARVEGVAGKGQPYVDMRATGDAAALAASWRRGVRRLTGSRFAVIDQPPETLATPVLTRNDFALPPRIASGQAEPVVDDAHMNAAYGAIILRLCLAWAETALSRQGRSRPPGEADGP